jgi:hypothetical protein
MVSVPSVHSRLLLAALLMSGCGADGAGGIGTAPEGEGRIALHNRSVRDAWYAYTRRCGVAVWGEDELGPAVVVRSGQSAAWSEQAGCYDLLVLTNPRVAPRYEARYDRRLVTAGQQTAVAIADDDWTEWAHDSTAPAPMP